MQFKRAMADLVMAGKKTQTRRINPAPRWMIPGRRVPVQCGYRDKAMGYIVLDRVYYQRLGKMLQSDIEAEGFQDFDTFMDYINSINKKGKRLIPSSTVTVYKFHLEATDE